MVRVQLGHHKARLKRALYNLLLILNVKQRYQDSPDEMQ